MELKTALDTGDFKYKESSSQFTEVKHCGELVKVECLFPGINIITCNKCDIELQQKELSGYCHLKNNKE